MNEQLRPVFEVILWRLEQEGIGYWVYGGISIAGFIGGFFRNNKDVDIFLKNADFEHMKSTIGELCQENNFELINYDPKTENDRPKVEIKINKVERFSAIPVYERNGKILFKYNDGNQEYPSGIIEKVERNISGFRFYTPRNEFIKEMFIAHVKARPDKKKREKIIEDARHILSEEEFKIYFPNQSYEKP